MKPRQQELIEALEKLREELKTKQKVPFGADAALSAIINQLENRDVSEKKLNKLWKKYYKAKKIAENLK